MSLHKKTKTNTNRKNPSGQKQGLQSLERNFEKIAEGVGFAVMSAAAVLSLVEVEHLRTQRVELLQPAYATVGAPPIDSDKGDGPIRREKEESPHSVVSYGTTMRSHPTAGRR